MGSGVFNNINSSERKQLFSGMGRCRDPALPVADNLLGEGELGGGCAQRCCSWVKVG
jgi:hypothetical protein